MSAATTSKPRFVTQTLTGWGNNPRQACNVYRPERPRDVGGIVREAQERSLLARGLGRSYGDAALNESNGVILQTRLNRMLAFDDVEGTLTCEAGLSFAEIIDVFLPRGWFLPVTPGTKFVTVGGAIAADVHGKNHHRDGSIGNFVQEIELLMASGEVLICSRESNANAFWATIGGMGLTGFILRATIRLMRVESAYLSVSYRKAANLDAALEISQAEDERFEYSVAWIDCLASGGSLGRSILIRGNHAPASAAPDTAAPFGVRLARRKTVPFMLPGGVLNSLTVGAFNGQFYRNHDDREVMVDYDRFFYPLDSIGHWNRLYGRRGFAQYQVLFPLETSRRGLIALLEALSASKRPSFLSVLKRTGSASGGILSFPFPGQTLALDLPLRRDLPEFLRGLDRIVLEHGGRLYLAKDAFTTSETFAAMYPQLGRFREIKRELDPENRLSSSQARRLRIVEER